jgi:ribosomal protein S18 acetylase RimI-like enzyme
VEFFIREATEADYEQLCELFTELDAVHNRALPHIFRPADGPARSRELLSGFITDEQVALFVAENKADGQLLGLVQVAVNATPDIPILVPRRLGRMNDLVVKQKWQRVGIGQALVEQAQQWVLAQDATEIQLGVWEFNQEAIAFYEKLGYTTAKRTMLKALA